MGGYRKMIMGGYGQPNPPMITKNLDFAVPDPFDPAQPDLMTPQGSRESVQGSWLAGTRRGHLDISLINCVKFPKSC